MKQTNKKTYRLNIRHQIWPSIFTFDHDLDLEWSKWSIYLPVSWDSHEMKNIHQLNTGPQMWLSILTITLNFQGQMFN